MCQAIYVCPVCNGEGDVRFNPGWPDPQTEESAECSRCWGRGWICRTLSGGSRSSSGAGSSSSPSPSTS